jgi:uncharacterized protein GlcG (DUF336 family)
VTPAVPLATEEAAALARSALDSASAWDARVGVVVLDQGGHLLCAMRHADAYFSAIPLAQAKAFTALNFRRPSHEMAERLGSIGYAVQISHADPRLAFLKGGLPLTRADRVVGAIGVSGGSADQDLDCCQHAERAWRDR